MPQVKVPTPPNRLEVLKTLRVANADVAFATAFMTLTTGIFLVGFIQSLGGSDLWIGLLSAIPSLMGIIQIPGAIWGRGFPTYKRFVFVGGSLNRLAYVPLIFLPFLPVPDALKLTLLMVAIIVAGVAGSVVNPIYNDWMAEMVPANSRGTFFARRNAIATGVGAAVGLLGAGLLDRFRSQGDENLGFTVVFSLAIVCAAISLAFFGKMRDTQRTHPIRQDLKAGVKAIGAPFGDRDFRKVLIFLALFIGGQAFPGNLYGAFARESLELEFTVIQLTGIFMAVGNILTAGFWGFLADKYGNKPILIIVGFLLALNPIPWILGQPGRENAVYNASLLLSTHVLMGIVWGGVALCQFNLLLATAKPQDRANYIAAGMATIAVMGGVAPLLGATMMSVLRTGFEPATAYKIVFGTTFLFRFLSVFFLMSVKEPGARNVRIALGDLRRITPKGVRAMRSLSRSSTAEGREAAIASVATEGVTLAADELLRAMSDPQPNVRRQAAKALAQLRDQRATHELIRQIELHPEMLEEETLEALGALEDPQAIPTLVAALQSPRPILRRSAARALGRLGATDPQVVAALIESAAETRDPDLRRAALQALRVLNARDAVEVVRRGIMDPLPSVRIAAAEAAAELGLTEAAPDVRESLARYQDEASSEVAYSLGATGELDDLPRILQEAARSSSPIIRRRCLLGAARLLEVEPESYRLILKEGMPRDAEVAEQLRLASRRWPRARVALQRFADGDEQGALRALAQATGHPGLKFLSEYPVEELFLVAAPLAGKLARR